MIYQNMAWTNELEYDSDIIIEMNGTPTDGVVHSINKDEIIVFSEFGDLYTFSRTTGMFEDDHVTLEIRPYY